MLTSGGRGGGEAQFADTDGELVGDGVDVAEGVIEGVTEAVTDGELVGDGVDVAEGVIEDVTDGELVNEGLGVVDAALVGGIIEILTNGVAEDVADREPTIGIIEDCVGNDIIELAVAEALALAEDVGVGVGIKGEQQNVKSVAIEVVIKAQP
jgi:hypothetical protein